MDELEILEDLPEIHAGFPSPSQDYMKGVIDLNKELVSYQVPVPVAAARKSAIVLFTTEAGSGPPEGVTGPSPLPLRHSM